MVSLLWIASDTGDIAQVQFLLREASAIDIEIKDDAGATPLVQAVRNGHGHVVRALLDAGADPSVLNNGLLEQLTADATILELLSSAKEKKAQAEMTAPTYVPSEGYPQEYLPDPAKAYYAQPHGSYMYYPSYHPGAALLPDGTPAPYYPPPPLASNGQPHDAAGGSNLPPPEIARLIPCRYFPACRYGPSCIFAHPQGPYFQGPLPPPAQYPAPYDPMAQPPYGGYYAIPQAPYPPNGVPNLPNPMSPASHQSPALQSNHVRMPSEIMSPTQAPFSPSAPPIPYGLPMPAGYPQPGQAPIQPIPAGIVPLSPPQQPAGSVAQPNGVMYPPTSPVTQPTTMHRRDHSTVNPQNAAPSQISAPDGHATAIPPLIPPQQDAYAGFARLPPRDGVNHARRGSVRRLSTAPGRKPPCAFFPSGRCRNGESCRFPHIMPDAGDPSPGHFGSKFGPRGRQHPPATEHLNEKMSGLNLRTDSGSAGPELNGHAHGQPNGVSHIRPQGNSKVNNVANGMRHEKHNGGPRPPHSQQRIPNAEDFPVLAGSTTPPARSPGAAPLNGPTAAQVLQAPPPVRKDTAKSVTQTQAAKSRDSSAERPASPEEVVSQVDTNGAPNGRHVNGTNGTAHEIKPLSFAAVATAAATTPESASTVSVSA
ncbi:hypothetical protein M0805_007138 [Coniferiporia weirii]|nr:hypothetical protein M0805_007138 [Coniferiporia weirii]